MDKKTLLKLIKERKSEHERLGQAVFNFCCVLFPEKANKLRATDKDPFHLDERIDVFLDYVLSNKPTGE